MNERRIGAWVGFARFSCDSRRDTAPRVKIHGNDSRVTGAEILEYAYNSKIDASRELDELNDRSRELEKER